MYAQVGWVCIAQLLAIIDFSTSASSDSTIGMGLAINSLWLWMIQLSDAGSTSGTQTSADSIKAALIDIVERVLTP